jgi:formiminoglutamase
MIRWINFQSKELADWFKPRAGEQKIGQTVGCGDFTESPARFVLVAVSEDIGIQGNLGRAGAKDAWKSIFAAFLNMQDNRFLKGEDIHLAGVLDINTDLELLDSLRSFTSKIDEALFPIIQKIRSLNKIPIVIGGGHNNAFPCLKGCSLASGKGLQALNIDPHADFRALEGRHSGNGFSYAMNEKFLSKYFIYGLHQSYNSEVMLSEMESTGKIGWNYFDEIYVQEKLSEDKAKEQALAYLGNSPTGIELDIDSIVLAPSSAITCSGLSPNQARKLLFFFSNRLNSVYLHLPELAPKLAPKKQQAAWAKLGAYLISDFIKAKTDSWKH